MITNPDEVIITNPDIKTVCFSRKSSQVGAVLAQGSRQSVYSVNSHATKTASIQLKLRKSSGLTLNDNYIVGSAQSKTR